MAADLIERLRAATMGFDWADLPDDASLPAVPLLLEAADALASKDAALSEMRAELERWQANWDANVQEMSEKFRAVNLAQVMAGTNLDLLARAEAAESQLEMARKALVIANAQLADMEFLTVEGFLGWKKDRARLADGETK